MKMPKSIRRIIATTIAVHSVACFSTAVLAAEKPAAAFEGAEVLIRPEGYRAWVFVGSSLGLEYDPKAEKTAPGLAEFKNVYIDPAAFREFAESGKFPEGTVFILETASSATMKEPGLQGTVQKDYIGLSAAVKDTRRFKEGWAYFSFKEGTGKFRQSAKPAAKSACYDCHRKHGAIDNVFTQFYPVLRAAAPKSSSAPPNQNRPTIPDARSHVP